MKRRPELSTARWARLRRRAFNRAGWRCQICGRHGRLEADHIRPIRQGGAMWDLGNLQAVCRGCHIRKTARENRREGASQQRWRGLVRELRSDKMGA